MQGSLQRIAPLAGTAPCDPGDDDRPAGGPRRGADHVQIDGFVGFRCAVT